MIEYLQLLGILKLQKKKRDILKNNTACWHEVRVIT